MRKNILNSLLKDKEYTLVKVPNKTWVTAGYKIPRSLLSDVLLQEKDAY